LAGFIVELVQFVPCDRDDLRAFAGLLDLLLQIPAQLRAFEQRFPLLLGQLERVGVTGLLGPLEFEGAWAGVRGLSSSFVMISLPRSASQRS
jgi:hypothetical protein